MRRDVSHTRLFCLVLTGLFTVSPGLIVAQGDAGSNEVIRDLREQVAELQRENARLRQQLAASTSQPAAEPAPADPVPPDVEQTRQLERQLTEARARVELLEIEKQELEKLAGVTAKGELLETQKALIRSRYDKKSDRTTVEGPQIRAVDDNVRGFMEHLGGAAFEFSGRKLEQLPETYQLVIYTRLNQNRRYRNFKQAKVIFDGQTVDAPVLSYRVIDSFGSGKSGSGRATSGVASRDERIALEIDSATAARIGAASTLSVHFPKIEIILGRDHIAMVEGLRRRATLLLEPTPEE